MLTVVCGEHIPFMKKLKNALKDNRGASVLMDLLILVAITAVVAVMVSDTLQPKLADLHLRVEVGITEVTGSGY